MGVCGAALLCASRSILAAPSMSSPDSLAAASHGPTRSPPWETATQAPLALPHRRHRPAPPDVRKLNQPIGSIELTQKWPRKCIYEMQDQIATSSSGFIQSALSRAERRRNDGRNSRQGGESHQRGRTSGSVSRCVNFMHSHKGFKLKPGHLGMCKLSFFIFVSS